MTHRVLTRIPLGAATLLVVEVGRELIPQGPS